MKQKCKPLLYLSTAVDNENNKQSIIRKLLVITHLLVNPLNRNIAINHGVYVCLWVDVCCVVMLLLCRASDWVVFICRERWTSFSNTGSHSTWQHHCCLSGLGQFTQTGSVRGLRWDSLIMQLGQLVDIWVMSSTVGRCAHRKRTKWISLKSCQLCCLIYHVVSCVVCRG